MADMDTMIEEGGVALSQLRRACNLLEELLRQAADDRDLYRSTIRSLYDDRFHMKVARDRIMVTVGTLTEEQYALRAARARNDVDGHA